MGYKGNRELTILRPSMVAQLSPLAPPIDVELGFPR